MSEALARSQLYVLDSKNNPIRSDSLHDWARYMEEPHRVGDDTVRGVRISTVFIGLGGNVLGLPRPFETLLFRNGDMLPDSQRYATWDAARRGHEAWVKQIRERGVMAMA